MVSNQKIPERASKGEVLRPRLKPTMYQFTDLQIEAAKLRAQGFSLSQIGQQLRGRGAPQISEILTNFRPTAERMRKAVEELRAAGYWLKQVDYGSILSKAARESVEKTLREELWPFSRAPFGYDIVIENGKRRLKINSAKAQIVKVIFQTSAKGKPIYKFLGLPKTLNPYQIVKKPIYKGYHRLGREILPEKHESLVIVDEQTWERAQEMRMGPKPRAPYGYEWSGKHLIPLPEEREIIREIFKLRLERKGSKEITKTLQKQNVKIDRHTILDWIRDPLYKTKVWNAKGGQVEVEGEPFIDAKTWDAVQRVHISRRDTAEKQRSQTEYEIESVLSERRFATAPQIAEATGISYDHALGVLHRMKWKGRVIMKLFGSHGRLVWALKKSAEVESTGPRKTLEEILKLGEPESLIGILECLLLQPLNTGELQKKTELNRNSLARWLRTLAEKGILERKPIKKFRQWSVKSDFMKPVQDFLEDYRSCVA
jgi:hypothetical protein